MVFEDVSGVEVVLAHGERHFSRVVAPVIVPERLYAHFALDFLFGGQVEKCALGPEVDGVACASGPFRRCGHAGPPVGTNSILRGGYDAKDGAT